MVLNLFNFRNLLPKSKLGREISVLISGSAGAQLITLIGAPILTRLYPPESFGNLAVYSSILSLSVVISCLRFELAIPLPKDDLEAANTTILSLLLVIFSALVFSILIPFLGKPITSALNLEFFLPQLWFVPAGILLNGTYSVFNYWAIRKKTFSAMAGTKVTQSATSFLVTLSAYQFGTTALLVGHMLGQSIGTSKLGYLAFSETVFKKISWTGIKKVAHKYRDFPIYSTWEGFANTAGMQLPPLLFAGIFGNSAAGLYFLAHRVLTVPMQLIGSSIGQVFLSSAAEARRTGELGKLGAGLYQKLSHIGVPPMVLIMLVGPDLFQLVFGPEWTQAGVFARWMAPWLCFVFIGSPMSTLFAILGKQKSGMIFQFVLLLSRIFSIGVGAWNNSLSLSILLFSATSFFCWMWFLFWIARSIGNPAAAIWKPIGSALIIGLACSAPVIIGLQLDNLHSDLGIFAIGISLVLIMSRYWILIKRETR